MGHVSYARPEERPVTSEQITAPLTVAEYLMLALQQRGMNKLFLPCNLSSSPLLYGPKSKELLIPTHMLSSSEDAFRAAIAHAKRHRGAVCMAQEEGFLSLLQPLTSAITEGVPLFFILSLPSHHDPLVGSRTAQSRSYKILQQAQQAIKEAVGAEILIDDRRTAAARIDRALDTLFEKGLPVMLSIVEGIAHDPLPSHVYRKTIFNHEENALFESAWSTILSRLEHTSKNAIVLGRQLRSTSHLSQLVALSQRWDTMLIVDPEIRGLIPTDSTIPKLLFDTSSSAEIALEKYHGFFCFGVASDHPWTKTFLEEILLKEAAFHDIVFVNTEHIFFGDTREPFHISSLEEFFQATPVHLQRDVPQNVSTVFLAPDICQEELIVFCKNLPKACLWRTRREWILQMLEGLSEPIVGLITDDIALMEQVVQLQETKKDNLPKRILLVGTKNFSTKSIPQCLKMHLAANVPSMSTWCNSTTWEGFPGIVLLILKT